MDQFLFVVSMFFVAQQCQLNVFFQISNAWPCFNWFKTLLVLRLHTTLSFIAMKNRFLKLEKSYSCKSSPFKLKKGVGGGKTSLPWCRQLGTALSVHIIKISNEIEPAEGLDSLLLGKVFSNFLMTRLALEVVTWVPIATYVGLTIKEINNLIFLVFF